MVKNYSKSIELNKKKYECKNTIFSWWIGSPGGLIPRRELIKHNKLYIDILDRFKNQFKRKLFSKKNIYTLNKFGGEILTGALFMDINVELILKKISDQYLNYKCFLSGHLFNENLIDTSFFKGESGIGYLILKLIKNDYIENNVLYPSIIGSKTKSKVSIKINFEEIIFNKYLPFKIQKKSYTINKSFYNNILQSLNDPKNQMESNNNDLIILKELFNLNTMNINPLFEISKSKALNKNKIIKQPYVKANSIYKVIKSNRTKKDLILMRTIYGAIILRHSCCSIFSLIMNLAESKIHINYLSTALLKEIDYELICKRFNNISVEEDIEQHINICLKTGLLEYIK